LFTTNRQIPAGSKIRALVVDDSVVIRRLVTHALGEDPDIEVVGSAPDGIVALARIPQLNPHIVTLDIEMPRMDGLATLRQIRKQFPDVIVIMFSTLTDRGAAVTMEALALGAQDYVAKASNTGSLDRSLENLRGELIPKVKQFFELKKTGGAIPATAALPRPVARVAPNVPRPHPQVVVIGVSTGGPTALGTLIPKLPADFPLPILIVQHMPPMFTRLLAERLQAQTKLRVMEASEGTRIEPGAVLIAPGNYHMRVQRNGRQASVVLDQQPPENSCRPAADVLFRSVAEAYGGAAIGVVLTGMGKDGFRGCEALKSQGAYIIAQDEASSVVWGMPGFVSKGGVADATVSLQAVVPEILGHL
jgi:two-component system, chemotaxis family, protein-glutamate methylesterase/glutaminase